VLSYLAEAIAAGFPYAWERFGILDSTLAAVRQAACAYAAEQKAAAAAELAAVSVTPCSLAEPPAGPCDDAPGLEACGTTEIQGKRTVFGAAAVTSIFAADSPASEPAPAVLQPLGGQCAAHQPCPLNPVIPSSAINGSARQSTSCTRPAASVDAAACIADLVSQRESLRPLKEHLLVEINFGVLRLALAHLLRLSAGHTVQQSI